MGGNPIGDNGIAMMIECLQYNETLTKLFVYECGLSVKGTMRYVRASPWASINTFLPHVCKYDFVL